MNDPEALKVREWRHKLQKAFLNTKATPKEDVSTLHNIATIHNNSSWDVGHALT